jgi:hypothetical protein
MATLPTIEEPTAPNDGDQAVEDHPAEIQDPNEPPTYGERNCYLPEQLKNALKVSLESLGTRELYDRRREVMRDRRNRYYRKGFQHIYENRQTGMFAVGVADESIASSSRSSRRTLQASTSARTRSRPKT